MFQNIKGSFYRFCGDHVQSELPKISSIFSRVDFSSATKYNLTDPKDWLLYDTGFVLKMKNKSPLKVSLRGLMRIVENLRDSDLDSDSE